MVDKVKVDRRVIKTKKAIHQAFLALFYTKNIESITINDIADLANVNRGTVYLHYSDKYDLLDHLIAEHIQNMIGFCNPDSGARMRDELTPLFEYLKENIAFFTAMFATHKAAVFRKHLTKVISVNMKNKLDRNLGTKTEISNELSAQFMTSAFIGMIEWWVEQGMPHSSEFMAIQLEKLFEKNEKILPGVLGK
ncbi:TetR/AcrR family transcriptional regulator [Paenibacillus brasilensis]|uniref:AcrR family transcriptional regulator n=1 Tax=Paenibacillus brasilensis TaxID=128574 RepID=A0ABU0L7E7_9BACL|nr:TetR/AcrR family transcriptional regulator C-terminal domain-containing protein [Paenibacillus brasilensis]MDQ0497219.1 AcrR family transcriptional regulator [Paenibacillus brasilensis]